MLGWRRICFTLGISIAFGLLMSIPRLPPWHHWKSGPLSAIVCTSGLGLGAMLVFGLFEQWPKRLPRWIERWVLQVVGVAVAMPIITGVMYWLSIAPGTLSPHEVLEIRNGFIILLIHAVLVAPWAALGALVRQTKPSRATRRSSSSWRAASSSARPWSAVAPAAGTGRPAFLFNTLANVQALVDAGSPQAKVVLRSLVAYLRAAVPRLNEPATTLGQEVEHVEAYSSSCTCACPIASGSRWTSTMRRGRCGVRP
jgi:hypothetical protein